MECNCRDLVHHFRFQQERYSPGYYGVVHRSAFVLQQIRHHRVRFQRGHRREWQRAARGIASRVHHRV